MITEDALFRAARRAVVAGRGQLLRADATTPDASPKTARVNHPITVEPAIATLKVPFSGGDDGLIADDAGKLRRPSSTTIARMATARSRISAPDGAGRATRRSPISPSALAAMGVPPRRILVATHDAADGDDRVEIGYVAYTAHTDACGDWSQDLAVTDGQPDRPRISAARCSTISPPWSPIRATYRAARDGRCRCRRAATTVIEQLREGQADAAAHEDATNSRAPSPDVGK